VKDNHQKKEVQDTALTGAFQDYTNRTIWQKPDVVMRKMGDLSQKVVADIGAGTGYFAFRLALKAKKVIAIDIDQDALDTIQRYIPKLPEAYRNRIETRLAKANNPMLQPEEADMVVIINTIAYISDLQAYLNTLRSGMKKGAEIMIVDYKMKRLPISAPPRSERVYLDVVEDMVEKAGFRLTQSDDTSLDYQYILKAVNP
jgi:ubiquinone/menaquinone biosynthesis C-methylase UbiE